MPAGLQRRRTGDFRGRASKAAEARSNTSRVGDDDKKCAKNPSAPADVAGPYLPNEKNLERCGK